jgi:hypothetical protein
MSLSEVENRNKNINELFHDAVSKEATHQYEIRKWCTGRVLSTEEEMKQDWETASKIVVKELFRGEIPVYLFEETKKMCPICFTDETNFISCMHCHNEMCVKDAIEWIGMRRNSCPFCRQVFFRR